jgi:hypothetical protein
MFDRMLARLGAFSNGMRCRRDLLGVLEGVGERALVLFREE